jgi:hypothetical protein
MSTLAPGARRARLSSAPPFASSSSASFASSSASTSSSVDVFSRSKNVARSVVVARDARFAVARGATRDRCVVTARGARGVRAAALENVSMTRATCDGARARGVGRPSIEFFAV